VTCFGEAATPFRADGDEEAFDAGRRETPCWANTTGAPEAPMRPATTAHVRAVHGAMEWAVVRQIAAVMRGLAGDQPGLSVEKPALRPFIPTHEEYSAQILPFL
jgi:hypothetical protein